MSTDKEQNFLRQEIEKLHHEHFELDREIKKISQNPPLDQITIQRLKKEKLVLKDQIQRLRSQLLPDIIA